MTHLTNDMGSLEGYPPLIVADVRGAWLHCRKYRRRYSVEPHTYFRCGGRNGRARR